LDFKSLHNLARTLHNIGPLRLPLAGGSPGKSGTPGTAGTAGTAGKPNTDVKVKTDDA
jgi:hypothetical protein